MKQVKTNYIKHKTETTQEGTTFSLILGRYDLRGILPHPLFVYPLPREEFKRGGFRNIGKIKPLKDNPLLYFIFIKENAVCIRY